MSEISNNTIAGGVGIFGSGIYMVYRLETMDQYVTINRKILNGNYVPLNFNVRHERSYIKSAKDVKEILIYKRNIQDAYISYFKNMSLALYAKYIFVGAFVGISLYNIGKNWFGGK